MTIPKNRILIFLGSLLFVGILMGMSGCEKKKKPNTAKNDLQQEDEEQELDSEEGTKSGRLYVVLYVNTDSMNVFLQDVDTRRQEEYQYTGGTYIKNRYGDNIAVGQLETGELVEVVANDKKILKEINIADDTFILEEVTDISIMEEENIIQISGSNYFYDDAMKIFSEESIISLNDINSLDLLSIRGEDKKIHTIVVENGHGTIVLKNTDLFLGGMVTIGNLVAREVTDNMRIEIPEGTHQISVANNGFGGSKEIKVGRFEEFIMDLDEIKGEGAKKCRLNLKLSPEDAKVTVSGEKVDASKPVELPYGVYSIVATAKGYETFSGKLVVNSAEAEITITLEKESGTTEDTETKDKSKSNEDSSKSENGNLAGSKAGSKAGTLSNGDSSNKTESDKEEETDKDKDKDKETDKETDKESSNTD